MFIVEVIISFPTFTCMYVCMYNVYILYMILYIIYDTYQVPLSLRNVFCRLFAIYFMHWYIDECIYG